MKLWNDRVSTLIVLLSFIFVSGIFFWNTWQLERQLIGVRQESLTQATVIRELRRELSESRAVISAAGGEASVPAGTAETVEDSIESTASAARASDEAARQDSERQEAVRLQAVVENQENLIGIRSEIDRLSAVTVEKRRQIDELRTRVRFLEDQRVIVENEGEELKARRQAQVLQQQETLNAQISDLESVNRQLEEQILVLQSLSPGWPATYQTTISQNQIQQQVSEGRRTIAELLQQRQALERLRLERQLVPPPEAQAAKAEVLREKADVQARLTNEIQEMEQLQSRLANLEQRRQTLESGETPSLGE